MVNIEYMNMRSVFVEFNWICPHCKKETEIIVEVESPSDYMSENYCEHCGKEIDSEKLDQKISQEAAEAWVND